MFRIYDPCVDAHLAHPRVSNHILPVLLVDLDSPGGVGEAWVPGNARSGNALQPKTEGGRLMLFSSIATARCQGAKPLEAVGVGSLSPFDK